MKHSYQKSMYAILLAGAVASGRPAMASQSEAGQSRTEGRVLGSIKGKGVSVESNSDGSYSLVQTGNPGLS